MPLAIPYGVVTCLRRWFYRIGVLRSVRLAPCTISVGSIVVGGTGKSVVTMKLAKLLQSRGMRVAILTRGYGSELRRDQWQLLLGGAPAGGDLNVVPADEARMQSVGLASVPVVVGARRSAAWMAARSARADLLGAIDVIILDDGMQHLGVSRDIDVMPVSSLRPLGSGRLLPTGDLREGLSALSDVDFFLELRAAADSTIGESGLSKEGEAASQKLATLTTRTGADVIVGSLTASSVIAAPHCPGARWSDHKDNVVAVAGIAHPERFVSSLERMGIAPSRVMTPGDHKRMSLELLEKQCAGAAALITTAKDYWRQPDVFAKLPMPTFILELDLNLTPEAQDKFLARVRNFHRTV